MSHESGGHVRRLSSRGRRRRRRALRRAVLEHMLTAVAARLDAQECEYEKSESAKDVDGEESQALVRVLFVRID